MAQGIGKLANLAVFTALAFATAGKLAAEVPARVTVGAEAIQEADNRKAVLEFYDAFFNRHDLSAAERYLVPEYIQHNPHLANGRAALVDFFAKFFQTYPEASAKILRVASDGDLVWLHGHSRTSPNEKGMATVDIFRVSHGKIVEHWDVTQPLPEQSANGNSIF